MKKIEARKKYFVGTSGWNYGHWVGRFYSEGLSQKSWLEFYSQHFNTVEINMTFYRWPKQSFLELWYKKTPKDFKFTLKAPRTITHVRKLNNINRQVKDFYKLTSLLKNKLACILWQLPPTFKFSEKNLKKLENFLKILDKKHKNVIEFRDEEWWQEKIYRLLKKHRVCFCIVSGIEMPKTIISTAYFAYFRFHGDNYSSCYTEKQMQNYAEKMKELGKKGAREVYAYFNNDSNAYAIKNAKQLKEVLKIK